jgi:hypothetical protein
VVGYKDKQTSLWRRTDFPERVFTGTDHQAAASAYADKRTEECHANPALREALALFEASMYFELSPVEVRS